LMIFEKIVMDGRFKLIRQISQIEEIHVVRVVLLTCDKTRNKNKPRFRRG